MEIQQLIAQDISAEPRQVKAAIQLLDDGATVPFIARYRKEVTGGLSDTQLRLLAERLTYLRELNERRQSILKSIREQGQLTAELEQSILTQTTKQSLEDLYLPFRPKRRNKATQAREAGLQPFADALLNGQVEDPETAAQAFVDAEKGIADSKSALEGARHIIMEQLAEIPELVSTLRERLKNEGWIFSKVKTGQETKGQKFKDYFAFEEKISTIPSHRILALFRGRRAGFLDLHIDMKWQENDQKIHPCINEIIQRFPLPTQQHAGHAWLLQTFEWTWKIKLYTSLQSELFMQLKEEADSEAIRIFSKNLKDLLMTAPAGNHVTLGLDPGLRTGVKAVVVSATGDILEHCSVFPHPPQQDLEKSSQEFIRLCQTHNVTLVAIGNGTASRETQKWANSVIKSADIPAQTVVVSEAGASVYSASEFASKELPDLDVSYRGAVSIARRLQDPLSELVKIDPKSIGVGQYQHDVRSQRLLASLDAVVEDCVNAVGVDLNTASEALLRYVAGLNPIIAQHIVQYRTEHGSFKNRNQLREVPRLGQRTFEQAAGFLRIRGGDQPLDASGVHPESYAIVENIVSSSQTSLEQLLGNAELLQKLPINDFVNENASEITIKDILHELEKPGRDPRPSFKMAHFRDDVAELKDLKPDMVLEGVVTNVTRFGAFVDIGVHQDGLVHISSLANRFVKHPQDCVKAGDIVKVKVLEVDFDLKRIQLSMRLDEVAKPAVEKNNTSPSARKNPNPSNPNGFKPRPAPTGKSVAAASKKSNNNAKRPPEKPKASQPVASKATYSLALAFSSAKQRSDKRDDSQDES